MQKTLPMIRFCLAVVVCLTGARMAWGGVAPTAYDQKFTALGGVLNDFRPYYTDPDTTSGFTCSLVSGPSHGTVTFSGTTPASTFMKYTPTAGYTGTDSWTWKVNDGSGDSNVATCNVLVRARGTTGNRTVLIVVKSTLQSLIQSELDQLRADIINDGYQAEIVPTTAGDAATLWNFLKTQYYQSGRFVAGAILVGQLPFATCEATSQRTDFVYMNLDKYRATENCNFHMWVSRIWALSISGAELMFGDEVTLIKRVLKANHEYRRGISGLPYYATFCDTVDKYDLAHNLTDIWPTGETMIPRNVWPRGGDFMEEQSHGERHGYDDNYVGTWTIHDMLAQVRWATCCSCSSGYPGGVVNQQIFTRLGGNVMSVGATETTYSGYVMIMNDYAWEGKDAEFRQLLANGDTWGDAMIVYNPFIDYYRLVFYGDLSMKPMHAPANQMPVVNTLTASVTSDVEPLTVDFSASASDADGSIDLYEWFPTGHQYGRFSPTVYGRTSVRHIYDRPHRYLARVQAIDSKKAVGYKEVEIRVGPKPGQPIRINCGECLNYKFTKQEYYKEGLDYRDSANNLWLHDQKWADGTWGWMSPKEADYFTGDVLGTTDDQLFLSYRWDFGGNGITYKIPVANGTYTVQLGFADMKNTTTGVRLLDVTAEGVAWLTNYDIVAAAGAKTAKFESKSVTVADGVLDVVIKTAAGSTDPAIINCMAVIPQAGDNKKPIAKINATPTSGAAPLPVSFTSTGSSDPDGTISSYSWDFGDGGTATGASANHTYASAGVYSAFLQVTDNGGAVSVDRVTIVVGGSGNMAPVASDQSATTFFNTPIAITLSATDGNGDPLTYEKLTNPAHGTLTGSAPNYTYTPNTGYSGDDSFTWRAFDGTYYSNTATFTITVLPSGSGTTVTLSAMQDTFLDYAAQTTPRDEHTHGLFINNYYAFNEGGQTLIQFDLGGIPSGSTVMSATLRLFCWRENNAGGVSDTVQVIRCASAWSETTATWASDATNGTEVVTTVAVPNFTNASDNIVNPPLALEMDITSLVQGWVAGSYANHGVRILANDSTLDTRWVDMEDTPNKGAQYTPQLVVTYGGGGGGDTAPPTVAVSKAVLAGTVNDLPNPTPPTEVDVAGVKYPAISGNWTSGDVTVTKGADIPVKAKDASLNERTVNVNINWP